MHVTNAVAGKAILVIDEPIRLAQVAELLEHARAIAANGCNVEVDLASAEHLHAAGLQILRALERQTLRAGLRFCVVAASTSARNALELGGLGAWLTAGTEN